MQSDCLSGSIINCKAPSHVRHLPLKTFELHRDLKQEHQIRLCPSRSI